MCDQMCCHEPELPVADFNIDGAPAHPTGELENNRLGQELLDLNIRQLETVRGSPCEDDGPIR